jgi:O-antigen biosynthesis protein WbqV
VRDAALLEKIFAEHQPQLIFHAAALKHVPLAEANICETLSTNVLGTRAVAQAALKHKAEAMVLISTDKAVHPTSVMGASKRLAELVMQALGHRTRNTEHGTHTNFTTVRFGNVLGSTGSVVPRFQQQLAAGGPLTVTHPEMTRYFMTVREAVELVLQSAALGVMLPEENGGIFVLDMGEPVKIDDLAKQMIQLSGLTLEKIQIAYTGLRPGEKMHEELFYAEEPIIPTPHHSIRLAGCSGDAKELTLEGMETLCQNLTLQCQQHDEQQALTTLKQAVPQMGNNSAYI